MAEHVGDHTDGYAEREQRCCRGVPRIVQPDDPYTGVGEQYSPCLPVGVFVQRPAVRLGED
jgi:hypothetical protein